MNFSRILRSGSFALATLTIILNIAIIGCAGHVLDVYNSERTSNNYFLPLWPGQFDVRGLSAAIGTSSIIVIFNAGILAAIILWSVMKERLVNALVCMSSLLSIILSLVALVFNVTLNNAAPTYDTIQTWTCKWSSIGSNEVPSDFGTLCEDTRFTTFAPIASLALQLLLLGMASYSYFFILGSSIILHTKGSKLADDGCRYEEDKDTGSAYELASAREVSVKGAGSAIIFGRAL